MKKFRRVNFLICFIICCMTFVGCDKFSVQFVVEDYDAFLERVSDVSSPYYPLTTLETVVYPEISGYKPLTSARLTDGKPFTGYYTQVRDENGYYLLTTDGKIFECGLSFDKDIRGDAYLCEENGKFGLTSVSNKVLVPAEFDRIEYETADGPCTGINGNELTVFRNGRKISSAVVENFDATVFNGRIFRNGIIYNDDLSVFTIGGYFVVNYRSDGYSLIKDADNRYGYATPDGRIPIRPKYSYARPFINGVAVVKIDTASPYSLINIGGNVLLELSGYTAGLFDGHYVVQDEKSASVFDERGTLVGNYNFGVAHGRVFGRLIFPMFESVGVYDYVANKMYPQAYVSVLPVDGGFVTVNSDGFYELRDSDFELLFVADLIEVENRVVTVRKDGLVYYYVACAE